MFGAELQGFLRRDQVRATSLHEIAKLRRNVFPDDARPNARHDVAKAGFVDRSAVAEEVDLLWRLHLADVEPRVDGVGDLQAGQFRFRMLSQAQVVEADPRVFEPKLDQRTGGAQHEVRRHVARDLFRIERLDVALQRVETHGFRFVRHVSSCS